MLQNHESESDSTVDRDDRRAAREIGGNITLVARVKLWKSALNMFADSYGAGMGTGTYYSLTGFPRYQAFNRPENAHLYWLQLISDLGFFIAPTILCFLVIPLLLGFSNGIDYYHRWLSVALIAFWFCNIAGQSLLQQEILWYFAILLGIIMVGNVPKWLEKSIIKKRSKTMASIAGLLLVIQATGWAITGFNADEVGFPKSIHETYGYAFDDMGHRYLKVGSSLVERRYVPSDEAVLEFRVRAAAEDTSPSNPTTLKAMILDEYNRIVSAESVELTNNHEIRSLFLPITNSAKQFISILLTTDRVELRGNLLKSDERQYIGFYYYGCRWAEL